MTDRIIIAICLTLFVLAFITALVLRDRSATERLRIQTQACQSVGGYLIGQNCLPACGVSMDSSVDTRVERQ